MTDTQTLLDKDVQIEELARALRWISENGFGDNGRECAERATAALSTPSVGGSLAEENERLRELAGWLQWVADNADSLTGPQVANVARAALSGKDRT